MTGSDKLILAEFSGYSGQPQETFPFDQSQERLSTYLLTKEVGAIFYNYPEGLSLCVHFF